MAVVSQHERPQFASYDESDREITYRTSYLVVCGNSSDGLKTAAGASILPRRKASAVTVNGRQLVCSNLQGGLLRGEDNDCVFEFQATFSSTGELDPQHENPLLRRPEVSWSKAEGREPIHFDGNGWAITSSAGEQYDPTIELDTSDLILVYVDNVASWDPNTPIDYNFTVNEDVLTLPTGINAGRASIPKGVARLNCITADSGFENGIAYMRRRIEMQFRPRRPDGQSAWYLSVLDQGTYEIDPNDPQKKKRRLITDDQGNPYNSPITLDGKGRKLMSTVVDSLTKAVVVTGAKAVFRDYLAFPGRTHSSLGFRFP